MGKLQVPLMQTEKHKYVYAENNKKLLCLCLPQGKEIQSPYTHNTITALLYRSYDAKCFKEKK